MRAMFRRTVLALGTVIALTAGGSAWSAVLFQDDFNSETAGFRASLGNWTVSDGTIDIVGNGFFDFYPGNGLYLDMDGSSNNAGKITTNSTFSFASGVTYRIAFDYGRNTDRSAFERLNFGIGATELGNVSLAQGVVPQSLIPFQFDFVGAGTTESLFFEDISNDNFGIVLDNVVLSEVTPVPLPAALPLLASALGGFGLLTWRRSQREKA